MNLDLRDIPVLYINMDKDVGKRERIENHIDRVGFKTKIRDHTFFGYTFLEFSSIYRWQGEYELALEYSGKSIEIAIKAFT